MPRRRVSPILGFTLALTLGIALSLQLAPPYPASANGGEARPDINIDPEPMIKACWDLSEELRSSASTADQMNGDMETVACLQERLLDHLQALFAGQEYKMSPKIERRLNREGFKQALDDLARAHQGLLSVVYNNNAACAPSCGTMWFPFPIVDHAKLLEDMLRTVVRLRNLHEL